MEKYIKFDSGNLYSYNENGITIHYENNKKWKPSKLDYMGILYSDRNDYTELEEVDVALEYGQEVVEDAKQCFKKIENMIFKK